MAVNIVPFFGDSLKTFRRNAGLSQEDLAIKAGLDRSYISMLERGQRKPGLETVIVIAEALKITPNVLVNDVLSRLRKSSLQLVPSS